MPDGSNLGVVKTQDALAKARELELDLVVITEGARPPVAKILDFSKFLYDERKKSSQMKAKAKKSEVKEFVFGPTIDTGDLETRIQRAIGFVNDGNKVKITVKLMGREQEHPQIGYDRIERFTQGVSEVAKPESTPKRNGNLISITYVKR